MGMLPLMLELRLFAASQKTGHTLHFRYIIEIIAFTGKLMGHDSLRRTKTGQFGSISRGMPVTWARPLSV
jgi:hypothetical protein